MSSLPDVIKDTLCGISSGWGQVVTMMPFENIKVKMVSKPEEYNQGIVHAFKKTVAQQGFLSLWKGMLMPFLGVGAQVALQFGIVETLKKIMKKSYADSEGNLHWKYSFMCGTAAGLPSALVVTVLDHARFRVLLNKEKGVGSVTMAANIYRQHGLKKLYLGFYPTWARQCCLGVYFGVYDSLKGYANSHKYNDKLSSLLAGGFAGVCTWASMYPIDYAKTLIQSDSFTTPKYKNAVDCLKKEVAAKGLPVIFTGFPIMVLRAFVVNGAGFVCFEKSKTLLYS